MEELQKKQAVLQPFTPLWINLEERYQCFYAQSVECSSSTLHLKGTSLFSALYLNELIYYTLKPYSSEIELFQAYIFTLNHLSSTDNKLMLEAVLRRFEWTLLQTCGHGFSLTTEADTEQLVHCHKYYQFIPGKGLIVTQKGIPGEHLLALAADDLTQADCLKSVKLIMRKAIDHLLGGKEIKARKLYVN